jgi:hypothetical protein
MGGGEGVGAGCQCNVILDTVAVGTNNTVYVVRVDIKLVGPQSLDIVRS